MLSDFEGLLAGDDLYHFSIESFSEISYEKINLQRGKKIHKNSKIN